MSDIEIEIDGKKLQAKPNTMVIQVADEAGIYIPRFCYHRQLTVAANCRMCLVEVEKSPKTLPACATPVMPGMKVFTRSAKAIAAQRAVMEFLLINHPLDCPICDQGGECELQDLSMGYGSAESYYCEGKRSVKDQDIGPLIATDMTRCIQCTRCVRFGDEIAGFRELGGLNRGEDMEIGTYVQHAMRSEVSGNIIDLCPVGALTSKPFRFTARAWELQQHPSIAPHDCVGSNINVHTRYGKVMRVVPRENMTVNHMWLSDRDRFSYEGLYHVDRIEKPLIRIKNTWQETDWQTALDAVVEGLQKVIGTQGSNLLGALASPNSTLEEFYLLQKFIRSLGSSNIDHRLRQSDFTDQDDLPLYPQLNVSLNELSECDVILLIGSSVQKDQPIAGLNIRKAALKGAQIVAINMFDYDFHFTVAAKKIVPPHQFVEALADVAKNLESEKSSAAEIDQTIKSFLAADKKLHIMLGAGALNHPQAAEIRALATFIANKTNATMGLLTEGANSAGAWIAGAVPHREVAGKKIAKGMNAQEMCQEGCKAYVLLNVEPDLDCANPVAATHALDQAEFVVALSLFKNSVLEQYANVILPIAAFTETSGTFVNAEGKWQSFKGVATPFGESRPAWKVLRVLANFLGCSGFDYKTSEEVRNEIKSLSHEALTSYKTETPKLNLNQLQSNSKDEHLTRIGDVAIYSGDSLVRRGKALQMTQGIIELNRGAVHINSHTAEQLHIKEMESVIVKQKEGRAQLPVVFNPRVPRNAVFIASGIQATSGLSQLFGPIEIHKA